MTAGALPPDGQLAILLREQRPLAEIAVQSGLPLDAVEQFRGDHSLTADATPSIVLVSRGTRRRRAALNVGPWLVAAAFLALVLGFYAVQRHGASPAIEHVSAAGEVTMPSPCLVMWQGATPLSLPGAPSNCGTAAH